MNSENVQRSIHNLRDGTSKPGDDVYADELFERYSFTIGPTTQRTIGSALESGKKEGRIVPHLDDGESYPQSVEEEIDVYLHDKDGNVYIEKAVVRSRKDRRPDKLKDGRVVVSGDIPPVHQKTIALLQEEESGELWSPLDIRCRGTGQ